MCFLSRQLQIFNEAIVLILCIEWLSVGLLDLKHVLPEKSIQWAKAGSYKFSTRLLFWYFVLNDCQLDFSNKQPFCFSVFCINWILSLVRKYSNEAEARHNQSCEKMPFNISKQPRTYCEGAQPDMSVILLQVKATASKKYCFQLRVIS